MARDKVPQLKEKIDFLIKSPIAQRICKHRASENSFAEKVEIPLRTLTDGIRDGALSRENQRRLATNCYFSLDWPQWFDVTGAGRDTVYAFQERYVEANGASASTERSALQAQIDCPPVSTVASAQMSPPAPMTLTFAQFIARLDLSRVEAIMVFATTGEVTVRELRQALQDAAATNRKQPIQIRILLSAAYMSDAGRAAGTDQTRKDLLQFQIGKAHFKIEMRTYASAAVLRGAIVHHSDGSHSGYVGYYYWGFGDELRSRSRADSQGLVVAATYPIDPLLRVFLSWFQHYWGTNIINTLIFDFDDTIFATTDVQVAAWVGAIQKALSDGLVKLDTLNLELQHIAQGGGSSEKEFAGIFLDEQTEELILHRVFRKQLPDQAKQAIRSIRFAIRERLTEDDATPIQFVLNDIKALGSQYRLVIVSATSEELIERVLAKHEISAFSYVFGRNARRIDQQWQEVETKAQIFIRLSSMLGIPLERMVFVGDSDADYRSAKQLGLPFIENTFSATKFGRKTLIKNPDGRHEVVSGKNPGELINTIKKIELQIAARWSKL